MRPSTKPTGEVWRLLEEWQRNHPLRPNQSQMAGLFGVSTSLVSNWKFMESTMQADDMKLIAEKTGIGLGLIAEAVARDAESRGDSGGDTAATNPPPTEGGGSVVEMKPRPSALRPRAQARRPAARKTGKGTEAQRGGKPPDPELD